MRRSAAAVRPLFALLVPCAFAALAPPLLAGGCATSTDEGQTHGPTYSFEAGSAPLADGATAGDDATTPATDASSADASFARDAAPFDAGDASPIAFEDAGDASVVDAPGCTSTVAVLAGGATSLVGAVATGQGAFATQALTGSLAYAPALAPSGAGFEGLVAASGGGALSGVGFSGTTWSSPAALGGAASTIDAPALASLGATLQAVYLSPQNLYFHAQFDGAAWDTGSDKVLPHVDGGAQSFGPVRASTAASATELVIAYEGDDGHLYAQSWTSGGGWQSAVKIGTGTVETNTAPAIVALTGGGASDFLVVYPVSSTTSTNYLNYALRNAASKAWSATTVLTNIAAYTPNAPSLAAMSNGRAIVGWRGGNGLPYTMEFASATAAWSAPTPIGSINVDAAPSLATGVCGHDAVAALATNGAVTVGEYASGAWVPPTPIAGIAGASFAAIATLP